MTSSGWPDAREVEAFFLARETGFAFHGARLRFELARSLFSSAGIDAGSALLLRHLQADALSGGEQVLDVGSGCGVLGVVLQALDADRRIVSVDRDALACRYTRRNVLLNDLDPGRHEVRGSLGFDEVGLQPNASNASNARDRFDLVVSNIPGKAGKPFLDHFVRAAPAVCRPDATIAVVVVQPLAPLARDAMERNGFELAVAKGNKTHQVFIASIGSGHDPAPVSCGFDDGVYDRDETPFGSGSVSWRARTVTGLKEFDSLSYPTRLLRSALGGVPAGPSLVVGPGQGHRAVIAAKAGYPPAVIVDRDLLALHATRRLLLDADVDRPELVHDVTIEAAPVAADHGLIVAHADDKVFAPWFFDQVRRYLDRLETTDGPGPRDLVLTGRASLLGRLEAEVLRRRRGHVAYKESQRGCRSLRFRLT